MKDRKAEACRHSADEVRRLADRAQSATERQAFHRLADGYDALAEQLEQVAGRGGNQGEEITWLVRGPGFDRRSLRWMRPA